MEWYSGTLASPASVGYELVEEIETDNEAYQFNLVGIFRKEEDGTLWYATDSGCSCPVPWEDVQVSALEPYDYSEVEEIVRNAYGYKRNQIELEGALLRLRKLTRQM